MIFNSAKRVPHENIWFCKNQNLRKNYNIANTVNQGNHDTWPSHFIMLLQYFTSQSSEKHFTEYFFKYSTVCFKISVSKNSYHTETSQLICKINQLASFYMILVFTERCFWIDFININFT